MIREITKKLYSDIPEETLYHYSTFSGLLGIIDRRALWSSDIRYMNDSAELKHTADLIQVEITRRIMKGHDNPTLLSQFLDWVTHRITNGRMLFGSSFRAHGNLLSQWRGYSKVGKGVSIGFDPDYILECAKAQSFQVGKCIYNPTSQRNLIKKVIDGVEKLAAEHLKISHKEQEIQAYSYIFEQIESDLLRIAAILKHPSFQEEDEWRLVSPVVTDYVNSPVLFREGRSMLVPYVEFQLLSKDKKPIDIEHMYLGPTSNIVISMNSLSMYLAKNGVKPRKDITYCQIPYRQQ